MDEEQITSLLEELKAQGISSAVIRKDGVIVHSSFAITDAGAGMLASATNIADALITRVKDKPKEVEIAFDNLILVIIPINDFLFCGAIKNREHKPVIRKYADKAKVLL